MAVLCAGLVLGWNQGELPRREPLPAAARPRALAAGDPTAPDLQLYREIVAEVRAGKDYYAAAGEKIPQFGFPISSPLNWRLPTYAWLFALLPNKCWVQLVLLLLAAAGWWLAVVAAGRSWGTGGAAVALVLFFGVVRWVFDGEAYLAQEVWAGVLLTISLAAHGVAACERNSGRRAGDMERDRGAEGGHGRGGERRGGAGSGLWSGVAVAAGTAALLFRELALPYCLVAALIAGWNRRWLECSAWVAGLGLFCACFAWHIGQVEAQLAGREVAASAGLAQWLRLGGLDFVLLTTRMNVLFFAAPAALLWLYLVGALVAAARSQHETGTLACLAVLVYVLAFAVVGRPENFYWGLVPAPLLVFCAAALPRAMAVLWANYQPIAAEA